MFRSPETMNFYGLYQAVRSRLHFSQVAAWWSRSNGVDPSYIVTRVVPYNEENLRKFRESPVEHTFPLAGQGDGNSIKVKESILIVYQRRFKSSAYTINSGTLSSIGKRKVELSVISINISFSRSMFLYSHITRFMKIIVSFIFALKHITSESSLDEDRCA